MKSASLRILATAAVVAALAACNLETAPVEPDTPVEITVDFCSDDLPAWVAYQNGVSPFLAAFPDAAGAVRFSASNRTTLVIARQSGSDSFLDIIYTTKNDLAAIADAACLEESGTKQVSGSVAGLGPSEVGLVSGGFSSAFVAPPQTTFTLTQMANRPLDLMASRVSLTTNEQHANRTIIRRSQNPSHGATIAPFDFASGAESFSPDAFAATVAGVGQDEALLFNNFFTQLETSHALSVVNSITSGTVPFVAVPAGQTAAGDYHDLFVLAIRPDGSAVRGMELFFRNPANQSLTLAPALSVPTITEVSTTPYRRLQVQLAAQLDYSTMMMAQYTQQPNQFGSRTVTILVTASFFGGTPVTWSSTIPDLSSVIGFNPDWMLTSGPYEWSVTGLLGRPGLVLGAKPTGNEVVQFASRFSSPESAGEFRSRVSQAGTSPLRAFALRKR